MGRRQQHTTTQDKKRPNKGAKCIENQRQRRGQGQKDKRTKGQEQEQEQERRPGQTDKDKDKGEDKDKDKDEDKRTKTRAKGQVGGEREEQGPRAILTKKILKNTGNLLIKKIPVLREERKGGREWGKEGTFSCSQPVRPPSITS
jgi:hypothetical protein